MIATHTATGLEASRMPDIRLIHDRLSSLFPNEVSADTTRTDMRLERYAPIREAAVAWEWSLRLAHGRQVHVYGHDNGTQAPDKPFDGSELAESVHRFRVRVHDAGIVMHTCDLDWQLPQLAECLDPRRLEARLRCVQHAPTAAYFRRRPDDVDLAGAVANPRLLAYRAGRRAVIAWQQSEPGGHALALVGKLYRKPCARVLAQRHSALNAQLGAMSRGRVRVSQPAGHHPDGRLIVYPRVPGVPAEGAAGVEPQTGAAIAGALARLHGTWMPDLAEFTAADELAVVRRWHNLLRAMLPKRAARANVLVDRLVSAADTIAPHACCTVHRDFYPAQCLLTPHTITLIDLDTLACGDPAIDLGNYLAHVALDMLRQSASLRALADVAQRVLHAYRACGGSFDWRNLAFFTATAACRLGAVHAGRTSTGRHAEDLWGLGARVLVNPPWRATS